MEFQEAVQQILDRGTEAIEASITLRDIDDKVYAIGGIKGPHPSVNVIKEKISKGGEHIGTLEVNPSSSIFYEAYIRGVLCMVKLEILELI